LRGQGFSFLLTSLAGTVDTDLIVYYIPVRSMALIGKQLFRLKRELYVVGRRTRSSKAMTKNGKNWPWGSVITELLK